MMKVEGKNMKRGWRFKLEYEWRINVEGRDINAA